MSPSRNVFFKIVLTGGPCGGKTTGQARLCTFFENLGWKVYRVPETASILLGGGVKFSDLSASDAYTFQENLLKTMLQIEDTYFALAESCGKNSLVICDRGAMDATAFVSEEDCRRIMSTNGWNQIDLRDNRYNLVIHMVSAAVGAEQFYTTLHHCCRDESLAEAQERDRKAAEAWIGHPYFDVIDNSTDFETKIGRMIVAVCHKFGIDAQDRLSSNSRKTKFLLDSILPDDSEFPPFQDFEVVHDYLASQPMTQARLRKRGQNGHYTYTHTVRRTEPVSGQTVEVRNTLTSRDYHNMLVQRDKTHDTIYKTRRCFLWNNQYFQLDIYREPCHPRCRGLVLMETYTSATREELQDRLPTFLVVRRDVTGDPGFSMFNLSVKDIRSNSTNKMDVRTLNGTR